MKFDTLPTKSLRKRETQKKTNHSAVCRAYILWVKNGLEWNIVSFQDRGQTLVEDRDASFNRPG